MIGVTKMNEVCLLKGLLIGDGHIDDRHLEIYNSSKSITRNAVLVLKDIGVPIERIKVDIYSDEPEMSMVTKWSSILELPILNFILRENTSPWKARTEKMRIRVGSKQLLDLLAQQKVIEDFHKQHYVKGLFDAEASVDVKGYIEFKQKATERGVKVVDEVYWILESFRIKTTKPSMKRDNRNNKTDVYLYVKDLEKYRKLIGFVDEVKADKLNKLIEILKTEHSVDQEKFEQLIKLKSPIWDMMYELRLPYHTIRKLARSVQSSH